MHSVIFVSDEASLEELNQLLADGEWWVDKISPSNSNGSWLVVLTDEDPNKFPFGDEEGSCNDDIFEHDHEH